MAKHAKENGFSAKWLAILAIAAFAIMGLVALVGFALPLVDDRPTQAENTSAATSEDASESSRALTSNDIAQPRSLVIEDLNAIGGDAEPASVTLLDTEHERTLSNEAKSALDDATAPYRERQWTLGYLFLNLQTGRGIAANVDAPIYGASTIKAPFALYLCEERLDANLPLEGAVGTWEDPETGAWYSVSPTDPEAVNQMIFDAVVESDNYSFEYLRSAFGDESYGAWLARLGQTSESVLTEWWPTLSVRDMARFWLELNRYLQSGGAHAAWLADMLAQTNVSFIRDGIGDPAVRVYNKAGWIFEDDYSATNDVAIIEADGQRYLLALMSDAAFDVESAMALGHVAKTLFDLRGSLN